MISNEFCQQHLPYLVKRGWQPHLAGAQRHIRLSPPNWEPGQVYSYCPITAFVYDTTGKYCRSSAYSAAAVSIQLSESDADLLMKAADTPHSDCELTRRTRLDMLRALNLAH